MTAANELGLTSAVPARIEVLSDARLKRIMLGAQEIYFKLRLRADKPWLHGIEHLTITHEGYVYWKDAEVEHFDIPWAYGEKGKESAEELARRCRILDKRGVTPTFSSAFIQWNEGEDVGVVGCDSE